MKTLIKYIGILASVLFLVGCKSDTRFELLKSEDTGIDFANNLEETPQMNVFTYLYFYNGGGVASGDLDGNGLPDLYFTANIENNRLYLNQGDFKFKDITEKAGVQGKRGWTTGVTMADVNGDGKLDIYVSQLGDYKNIQGKNQLYINLGNDENGIPQFEDQAHQWGLDLKGFSTQAVFFDYDLDGDLDMFMLNHSVHSNGTYVKADLRNEVHPLAGDKLMRNDGDKFTDVTAESGIFSSALGYGLGVAVSDINWDGYPDIYVGNDFHENDYLYINNGDGTFTESLSKMMMHTSRYSMGNDIADINNDGLLDIISLDMLPEDPAKLKASAGEDPYDVYHFKLKYGYDHQFSRNTLQLNMGNGKFSDIAMLSGVHATDWSWSSLIADFDLNGHKDIFITNGIKRRMNDLDYINFISNDAIQSRLDGELTDEELSLVNEMPIVQIPNYIYQNQGNLLFKDVTKDWGFAQESFSNGAIYVDLDNDGDLDLVSNNIDQPAYVFRNNTINPKKQENHFLKIKFEGDKLNTYGIGAKVFFKLDSATVMQEMFPTRGFQSSGNNELIVGLGSKTSIDSLWVVWPDKKFEILTNIRADQALVVKHKNSGGSYAFNNEKDPIFAELTNNLPGYKHEENSFIEFNREPLVPHMSSTEGPSIAVGDFNGDGMDDFWIAGAKRKRSAIFVQFPSGFEQYPQESFRLDSLHEDIAAETIDIDNDGDLDLVVVSGGNEFQDQDKPLKVRAYINDGNANFTRNDDALPEVYVTASCVKKADFDQDGYEDLFIGGSVVPWQYSESPQSYLLRNTGKGTFEDVSEKIVGLNKAGMIKDAVWADLNNNGYPDLILAGEWMPITVFMNENGLLTKLEDSGMEDRIGWWRSVSVADLDNDGNPDIVAGNFGTNSKLKATIDDPVKLYYHDFDGNNVKEQLLVYPKNGEYHLFATKDELMKQMPSLKRNYLKYSVFAQADMHDIFSKNLFKEAKEYKATEFRSGVFYNKNGKFSFQPLPVQAQFSTVNALQILDYNQDGHFDLLGAGNFYDVNVQFGRYDASFGFLLENDGKGNLKWVPNYISGLSLEGQTRDIKPIEVGNEQFLIIARNNDSIKMLKWNKPLDNVLVKKH